MFAFIVSHIRKGNVYAIGFKWFHYSIIIERNMISQINIIKVCVPIHTPVPQIFIYEYVSSWYTNHTPHISNVCRSLKPLQLCDPINRVYVKPHSLSWPHGPPVVCRLYAPTCVHPTTIITNLKFGGRTLRSPLGCWALPSPVCARKSVVGKLNMHAYVPFAWLMCVRVRLTVSRYHHANYFNVCDRATV